MANVSCNALSVDPGSPYYYTQSWRNCGIEDYIQWLRGEGSGNLEKHPVTDTEQYRYEGDFFGYLSDVIKLTSPELWWFTLRLNQMTRPDEFGQGVILIVTVKASFTDKVMQQILTYRGVSG